MGEMVPGVALKAAILGVPDSGDRVLELIEYPKHPGRPRPASWSLTDHGFSHLGMLCDDIAATRATRDAIRATLYSGRYLRHSEDGHLVLPFGRPRKIFLPFDLGAEAEADGTFFMTWPHHCAIGTKA